MSRLTLASGSPRRRELIRAVSNDVSILVTDVDESVPAGTPHDVMVRDVALRKALAALVAEPGELIVAADTTVALDGEWLAKPADDAEAASMLSRLMGRDHQVFTGVAVAAAGQILTDVTMSVVTVAPLTDSEVTAYVATGEGADKAGAYSVQGDPGRIVEAVEGCYTNVVGLPLCSLALLLSRAGLPIDAPAPPCGFPHRPSLPPPHLARGVADLHRLHLSLSVFDDTGQPLRRALDRS
jgi:septum formation protein